MSVSQFIPHGVQSFNMTDLGHPPAVWFIGGEPVFDGVEVEVLPIDIDAHLTDHARDGVGHPLARCGIDGMSADDLREYAMTGAAGL